MYSSYNNRRSGSPPDGSPDQFAFHNNHHQQMSYTPIQGPTSQLHSPFSNNQQQQLQQSQYLYSNNLHNQDDDSEGYAPYINDTDESPPESPIVNHIISNETSDIIPIHETQTERSTSSQFQTANDEKKYRKYSRIFLVISIISAALILVFESYMFATINIHHRDLPNSRYVEVSIYFALFIFAAVFQVVITLIGIITRNMLLLLFLCVFYCSMLVYTGIQYNEVATKITGILTGGWKTATHALNIATIGVIAATLILQFILLLAVLRNYVDWLTFKKVGADLTLRKMYTIFQIHRSILMFDFFFFTGFTIQFVVIMINDRTSVEFILTIVVIPLTIILLLGSDISACREFLLGSILAIVIYLGGMGYVLYKVIRLYSKGNTAYGLVHAPGEYFMGRKSLTIFAVFTLVLLTITIVLEVMVLRNYKMGLLPIVRSYYKWIPGYKKAETETINISDTEDESKERPQTRDDSNNSICID
ncbi:uncharacterized protein J8A68_000108 [[Candida] subhashii]|uniref:Uncharacterized protein n=1 Tax=[Candida] subhashii TaxID=561895 RepID=A0A8J5UN12_9ASCO|nr:uncharacterized protein J8A68_000108 [[Candida] subhashii]KAG7666363.1 hypothetical protein J8A68_000108 [[Candida] subhashii]